jgi:hypothetical protein
LNEIAGIIRKKVCHALKRSAKGKAHGVKLKAESSKLKEKSLKNECNT